MVNDKGFEGLVVKMNNNQRTVINNRIYAEAGVSLSNLVKVSTEKGLTGLEWAAGIPQATLGGAIRGNAGAFGSSMADLVQKVEVLSMSSQEGEILRFTQDRLHNPVIIDYKLQDCKFNYRDSIFKQNNNNIILSAELELKKSNPKKIQETIKEYLKTRKESLKQPLEYPSAGSVFKNPFNQAAGYLIDQAGLKEKRIGQAMVSEKHANFIVNLGGAKAKNVIKLIKSIKKTVKRKYDIDLEEEIKYLGYSSSAKNLL